MLNKRLRRTLIGICTVALIVSLFWGGTLLSASEKAKHITIVCSNDTLGTLVPCG